VNFRSGPLARPQAKVQLRVHTGDDNKPGPGEARMQDRAERIKWFKAEILPHEPALRRYLGRVVRSREEVDDLVSEALTSVYSADNWSEIGNCRAYLFTIARNLVYDAVRRRRVVAFETIADLDMLNLADTRPSAEAIVSARDELRALIAALDLIPPRARQVFILRRIEGLTLKEIGERLGLSVKTVENHMSKAIAVFTANIHQSDALSGSDSVSAWREKRRH
jgi:RNA polymerase sigma factor (sigma-70 family)